MMRFGCPSSPLSLSLSSTSTSAGGSYADSTRIPDDLGDLPLYSSASSAPCRLPAHKPVRLEHPKHPLAPPRTPVYFKYGEEHYPEETVPGEFTYTKSDGTKCRYITNFLVYNKRAERLLPLEALDEPRSNGLILFGSLLPLALVNPRGSENGWMKTGQFKRSGSKRRGSTGGLQDLCDEHSHPPPYLVRAELMQWNIQYGAEPEHTPYIWITSKTMVKYRLQVPAGRYAPNFAPVKTKFDVCTRIIKTLQQQPTTPYESLRDLITAATRLEKQILPPNSRRARSDGRKHRAHGSSDEDTGGLMHMRHRDDGMSVIDSLLCDVKTSWGMPFAVQGVRESTLINLYETIEEEAREFMAQNGAEFNIIGSPFMNELGNKWAAATRMVPEITTDVRPISAVSSFAMLDPVEGIVVGIPAVHAAVGYSIDSSDIYGLSVSFDKTKGATQDDDGSFSDGLLLI